MKKLNLGCGKIIKSGYVHLDKMKFPGVDVVHDLEKFPYPFKANTFDEIYCRMILEHVTDVAKVVAELYRISKPNAVWKVIVPYFKSDGAFSHIEHKHYFTEDLFVLWTRKSKNLAEVPPSEAKLEAVKIEKRCTGKLRKFLPFKKILNLILWNIYDDLYFEMRVKKIKN